MSADAPTPTTKREVLIAREAFERGVAAVWSHMNLSYGMESTRGWKGSFLLAAEAYPLPTVTRPRQINRPYIDGGRYYWWRLVNGVLQWSTIPSNERTWEPYVFSNNEAEKVWPIVGAIYAELLANPTETVEDDTP